MTVDDAFPALDERTTTRAREGVKPAVEDEPIEAPEAVDPVGMVYPSKGKGTSPHVVGIVDDPRGRWLTCTCRAYLSIEVRPKGCWAMQRTRALLGWQDDDDEKE